MSAPGAEGRLIEGWSDAGARVTWIPNVVNGDVGGGDGVWRVGFARAVKHRQSPGADSLTTGNSGISLHVLLSAHHNQILVQDKDIM